MVTSVLIWKRASLGSTWETTTPPMVFHAVESKWWRDGLSKKLSKGWSGQDNRPDVNPIEDLWYLIKNKISEKQPSSPDTLSTTIKDVSVSEISPDYCYKLIDSMPFRLQKARESHKILIIKSFFQCYARLLRFWLRKLLTKTTKNCVNTSGETKVLTACTRNNHQRRSVIKLLSQSVY